MPPHSLPSGDKRGPGLAGVAESDAAVVGGGCALTTPVGVNTGIGLALALALGAALAIGGCAAGAGVACDEQALAANNDSNATKPGNSER